MRRVALLSIALLPLLCAAQQAPKPSVEDNNIRAFKLGMEAGCRKEGERRKDPPAKIETRCCCMMKTLQQNVPQSVWKKIFVHMQAGELDQAMALISAYLEKIELCEGGGTKA